MYRITFEIIYEFSHRSYAYYIYETNLMFFTVDSLNLLFFKYSLLMEFFYFLSINPFPIGQIY